MNKEKIRIGWVALLSFVLLITGCSGTEKVIEPTDQQGEGESPLAEEEEGLGEKDKWLPMRFVESVLEEIVGFLDEKTIVYTTEEDGVSSVLTYNVFSGDVTLLYKKESIISEVAIEPVSRQVALFTSPGRGEEGEITIVNSVGNTIYSEAFSASEITLEPSSLAGWEVTAFQPDWSYEHFLLTNDGLDAVDIDVPFYVRVNSGAIAYLDWDPTKSSLTTKAKWNGVSGGERVLSSQAYAIEDMGEYVVVFATQEGKDKGMVSFFDGMGNEVFSYQAPYLSQYSTWQVPFFSYDEVKNVLYIIHPEESGNVDTYDGLFQMYEVNLSVKEKRPLFEVPEQANLEMSTDGRHLLYGVLTSEVIHLETGKREQFVFQETEQ